MSIADSDNHVYFAISLFTDFIAHSLIFPNVLSDSAFGFMVFGVTWEGGSLTCSIFPITHLLPIETGRILLFPFFVKVLEVSLFVLGSYARLLIIHSTFDFGVFATAFCMIVASSFVIFFPFERIDFIFCEASHIHSRILDTTAG